MTGSTAAQPLSAATALLVPEIERFIDQPGCSDAAFDSLALRVFAHQFANNSAYRRFCQGRGATLRQVRGWRDIPAVPIDAFKALDLVCQPPAATDRVFMTSGTTGAVQGRHHHPTLSVYDRSMARNFGARFMADADRIDMAVLFPTEAVLPNSSLAHYLALALHRFGSAASSHFVAPQGLDSIRLCDALARAEQSQQPFALLGATYSFVHLFDALAIRGQRFTLPPGSRVLDTGGYKGRSRELSMADFYARLSDLLGVPAGRCINMYGMTELSTQFYDNGNARLPSIKSGPHWIRSRVVDPSTGAQVPAGEPGILVHCDLANFNSVSTILTEDVGVAVAADAGAGVNGGAGFHLLGRAEGAQARGCSLAVDAFLQAARP